MLTNKSFKFSVFAQMIFTLDRHISLYNISPGMVRAAVLEAQTANKFKEISSTRLSPGTKSKRQKSFLESNFQKVICEPHQSKHSYLYVSM